MAVAKPWIVESPEPLTCQSLGGSPGRLFSQAMTLTGGSQGPAATACGGALVPHTPGTASTIAAINSTRSIRRHFLLGRVSTRPTIGLGGRVIVLPPIQVHRRYRARVELPSTAPRTRTPLGPSSDPGP